MRSWSILGSMTLLVVGCGKEPYAPVSGQVTLDGKPLAGAVVEFLPAAHDRNPNAGPSSTGRTDSQGKYTLQVVGSQKAGAIPGPHRVRITVFAGELPQTTDDADPQVPAQILPERYNAETELTVEVPQQGTATADFPLKSDPKLVPVSGRVILNGQPLARARVVFEPVSQAGQPKLPASSGTTDADGKYALQVEGGKKAGAAIGKHRVRISMDRDHPDSGGEKRVHSIPEHYNSKTALTCEVSDKGDGRFDFMLVSDQPGANKGDK